jgi:hypothetical protein
VLAVRDVAYAASQGALTDVTTGTNGICGGTYLCTAGAGYDGPTGLATPNNAAAITGSPVAPTPTPTPAPQLLGNPGFETGSAAPWSSTAGVGDSSTAQPAHGGGTAARIGDTSAEAAGVKTPGHELSVGGKFAHSTSRVSARLCRRSAIRTRLQATVADGRGLRSTAYSFQMVGAAVFERVAGSGDQIADRPGAEDFVRIRVGHHPRGHMDGNPSHLAVDQFALASVQADADPDAVVGEPAPDRCSRADRAGGAVEGDQKAVAGGVDLPAPKRFRALRTTSLCSSSLCSSSSRRHRRSPSRLASSVEPTMSVNMTVSTALARLGDTRRPGQEFLGGREDAS